MPNTKFTKDSNTFEFSKGRSFPRDDPSAVNVAIDYSDGGQMYPYDKGIQEKFFNLVFERLPLSDYNNLDNWLTNIAVGEKNAFTYTDEDGNDYTVRLMEDKNPLKEVASGLYSGAIRLRKEIL